jgi:hypothetical protein
VTGKGVLAVPCDKTVSATPCLFHCFWRDVTKCPVLARLPGFVLRDKRANGLEQHRQHSDSRITAGGTGGGELGAQVLATIEKA